MGRYSMLCAMGSNHQAATTMSACHPPINLQASAPLASQDVAGPPVLPSTFLREAVAGFLERLRAHQVGGTGRRHVAASLCLLQHGVLSARE